jgi:hypothetical protein
MFIKGVFGKTHPYTLAIIFMPILVWYVAKRAPFSIRKLQKYLEIFVDLFVGPSHFDLFFFFVFCIFFKLCAQSVAYYC